MYHLHVTRDCPEIRHNCIQALVLEWYQQSGYDLRRAETQSEIEPDPDITFLLWGGGKTALSMLMFWKGKVL